MQRLTQSWFSVTDNGFWLCDGGFCAQSIFKTAIAKPVLKKLPKLPFNRSFIVRAPHATKLWLLCDRPSFYCVWFTRSVVCWFGGSFAISGLCGWFVRIANVLPKARRASFYYFNSFRFSTSCYILIC